MELPAIEARVEERGEGDVEATGITPELLERLRPFLTESLMVLDRDWTVLANLAPPGGLIGRGLGIGLHTLEDMHPDDAVQVMELGMQAFDTPPGWRGSKLVRMRRGDGSYGRYEITAINCFDDPVVAGMVVRTREVPVDVADDLQGLETTSAIETVAELLPIGLLLLDARGRVVYANEGACGMLGREPEVLKRNPLAAMVAGADRPIVEDVLARMGSNPGREECTVRLDGARVERVQCRFSAEGRDQVTTIVVTIEDVTERVAAQQDLERRANHDALTGLRNRRSLDDLLHERLDREAPSVLAFLDLDGFKTVNDTHGHDRGDRLLVAVADGLREALPEGTEIARIGGDEFVVVTDPGQALHELVGTLRTVVRLAAAAEGLGVTASVGVVASRVGDHPKDLLRRADAQMYEAKARTRARERALRV